MAKIGFLGLGEMGTPMARRLLRAGHGMVVWNRSPERTAPLVQEGAAVAPSPAGAGAGADFVITMLATPEALEQVLFGTGGLARALSPGQVLIDMSTVGPDEVRSGTDRGSQKGEYRVRSVRAHSSPVGPGGPCSFDLDLHARV